MLSITELSVGFNMTGAQMVVAGRVKSGLGGSWIQIFISTGSALQAPELLDSKRIVCSP
ncbi:hypothetical protein D3C85_1029060 [compost metagenome]